MTEKELKQLQLETEKKISDDKGLKMALENNNVVKMYLKLISAIETEQEYQKFLEKLEIGEDGTAFSFYNKFQDKAHKNTHFGLSRCLTYAFDCIETYTDDESIIFNEITFYQLLEYLENAEKILTNMNYIEGDKLIPNQYGLEIYLNPKNYSVIDLKELKPLTNEQLQLNYDVKNIWYINGSFIKQKTNDNKIILIEHLTKRERMAFYGKEAQKKLGLAPKSIKTKTKIPNHN